MHNKYATVATDHVIYSYIFTFRLIKTTMVVSSYMLGIGSRPCHPIRGGWLCKDGMLLLLLRACMLRISIVGGVPVFRILCSFRPAIDNRSLL